MNNMSEDELRANLPPGAILAKAVSHYEVDGCRATISRAMHGLREIWLVGIMDEKGRVSIHGPGGLEPSESILNLLIGKHRAVCLARNAGNC